MRAEVTAAAPNENGRTIDMTVLFSTDLGEPIETRTLLIPADNATQKMAVDRMLDELNKMIAAEQDMPTQSQVDALVVGLTAVVPEP